MARYRRVPDGGLPQKSQINAVYGGIESASRDRGVDLPPSCFPALLSGATSPYGFAEAVGAAGGGWTALAGGRSGVAYEYNGVAGLAGKVAPEVCLHPDGTYRFQFLRRGVACTARLGVPVVGCPAFGDACNLSVPHPLVGLAGATVTATKGAFSASGTTVGPIDPFTPGNVSLDLSGGGAGTYTVTISRPRYVTIVTSVDVACLNNGMPYQVMTPDATHTCCLIHASGDTSPTCATAVPKTLHATTPLGTVTLTATFIAVTRLGGCLETFVRWEGTIAGATYDTLVADSYGFCVAGTWTSDVTFRLFCPNDPLDPFAGVNGGPGGEGWVLVALAKRCLLGHGMADFQFYGGSDPGCAEPLDLTFPAQPSPSPFDGGSTTVTE